MNFDPEEDTLLEEEQVLIGKEHGGNKDGDDDMIESVEVDMADCSSFGWDDVKQCMVMDNKEILATYLKAMINTHEEKKVGDMLSKLGFTYDEIISIALKFSTNPQLEKTFWSLGHN
ncbi:uncharacterized protein DS421_18g628100 [Arachis hypogaea]|nr:uncharacterized protein DS421_18g628100 [Arachis hypogaea]